MASSNDPFSTAIKLSTFVQVCGAIRNKGTPETCRVVKFRACKHRVHRGAKTQRKILKTLRLCVTDAVLFVSTFLAMAHGWLHNVYLIDKNKYSFLNLMTLTLFLVFLNIYFVWKSTTLSLSRRKTWRSIHKPGTNPKHQQEYQ